MFSVDIFKIKCLIFFNAGVIFGFDILQDFCQSLKVELSYLRPDYLILNLKIFFLALKFSKFSE